MARTMVDATANDIRRLYAWTRGERTGGWSSCLLFVPPYLVFPSVLIQGWSYSSQTCVCECLYNSAFGGCYVVFIYKAGLRFCVFKKIVCMYLYCLESSRSPELHVKGTSQRIENWNPIIEAIDRHVVGISSPMRSRYTGQYVVRHTSRLKNA
jgi:hypothetical protein